jgi:hypothetical protein
MRRLALLILLLLVTTLAHGQAPDSSRAARESRTSDWRTLVGGPGPENAQLHLIDGVAYIGANDFARLIDATKFWHGSPRKLVLRVTQHRLQFTVDNPFVLVDDHTVLLDQPVRSVGGEPQIPADFAKLLPDDPDLPRLVIDSEGSRVFRVPPSGIVGSPKVSVEGGVTRIVFPVDPTRSWWRRARAPTSASASAGSSPARSRERCPRACCSTRCARCARRAGPPSS